MQAKANRSMFGRNTTRRLTDLPTLWALTSWRFMRIWTILSNTIFKSLGSWLAKSTTISTNRCFDSSVLLVGSAFLPLIIVFKRKKQKKKKAIQSRRTAENQTGNGISPEGWQGNTKNSAKPPFLPCHYAVVFWLGGAVGVHLTFATFLFFFGYIFQMLLSSKCLWLPTSATKCQR